MVQIRKDSVQRQIITAAKLQFASVGFSAATMGAIARQASVATGTIYTYFPNKDALFDSIITVQLVEEFKVLTRDRIADFALPGAMDLHNPGSPNTSGELLQFYLRNRHEVIILLSQAEGTNYASFAQEYVREMEAQTLQQAQALFPGAPLPRTFRFMVTMVLQESVRGLVSVLREFEEAHMITEALSEFTRYQLAGIKALITQLEHQATTGEHR